jgi:2,3-diketo-5-methylthio-1-phosphopentane phosphatase
MKKFAFVSDFDGTMTDRDFYQIIMERFLAHDKHAKARYEDWRRGEIGVYQFLSDLFMRIDCDENELLAAVDAIPFDDHVQKVIDKVQRVHGDFYILSAGTGYYIQKILDKVGIKGVHLISNAGYYTSRHLRIEADTKGPYYSPELGIDKLKAVRDLKTRYETVYYAGDGEPDLRAAQHADVVFARGELKDLLKERHHDFVPFTHFLDIEKYLTNKMGIL